MRAVFLALLVLVAPVAGVVGATTGPPSTDDVLAALGFDGGNDAASDTAATAGTADADTAARAQANETNASLGTSISSFMQASTVGAESEVDRAMFSAAFATANENGREHLVRQRVRTLQTRLDRLESQREALLEDGELTTAERAKAARLQARIIGLRRAIESVETAADTAGVEVSGLDTLRGNARDLSGPEVATIATGLGDDAPLRSEDGPGKRVGIPDVDADNESDDPEKSGEDPGQDDNGDLVDVNVSNITDLVGEGEETPTPAVELVTV